MNLIDEQKGSEMLEGELLFSGEKFENKNNIAEAVKAGDIPSLLEWIDLKKTKLYKLAWAYLRNHADVEDVFHNTIIKVIENAHKLKNEAAFEGWFISILLNECRKILRNKKRVLLSEDIYDDVIVRTLDDEDIKHDLSEGLKNIDEDYKEVVILKYYSGYSQKEIAEILNMPIGTVKNKIFRGLRALREILR